MVEFRTNPFRTTLSHRPHDVVEIGWSLTNSGGRQKWVVELKSESDLAHETPMASILPFEGLNKI